MAVRMPSKDSGSASGV
jgi:hypothetical protein